MTNIAVNVFGPCDGRKAVNVECDGDASISAVRERVASALHVQKTDVCLYLCGLALNDDQRISKLNIGPATCLNAVLVRQAPGIRNEVIKEEDEEDDEVGEGQPGHESRDFKHSFFVHCKLTCARLQAGTLRVRCGVCKSTAVVVHAEPGCWDDVRKRRITASCLERACEQSFAEFFFKCSVCRNTEGVAPLSQVKRNWMTVPCVTCFEVADPIVVFPCTPDHALCIECFKAYVGTSVEQRTLRLHSVYGCTVPCAKGCRDSYIHDPHHFRICGADLYEKYLLQSGEKFFISEGGVYCPNPFCCLPFIPLETDTGNTLLCPECHFVFCRKCLNRSQNCSCVQSDPTVSRRPSDMTERSRSDAAGSAIEKADADLIRKISKPCPKCKTPVQKTGGCNHMTCVCGFNWCWWCNDGWTEKCQWNHWFE